MSHKAAQDSKSFGHYLLERLGDIFAELRKELSLEPGKKFFCKTLTLLERLNDDEEAPWREHKDQALTATRMGRELKEYDITSHKVKEGEDRGKGYWSDEVEAAVEKYKTEQGEKLEEGDYGFRGTVASLKYKNSIPRVRFPFFIPFLPD
jgi:hypothetical protein